MITLLQAEGSLRVETLSERLGVSAQTVRRDLAALHDRNILQRRHGQARLTDPSATLLTDHQRRGQENAAAKAAIAGCAARLIPNGATVFLSIGTSLTAMAEALRDHHGLTIVTNNLRAALMLQDGAHRLILTGGELRRPEGDFVDRGAFETFEKYRADFGIYGVAGIATDGTLLDFSSVEIEAREVIRAHSRTSILIADHSKFGRRAPAVGGQATEASHVVTDHAPGADFAELTERLGARLLFAEPETHDGA